MPCGTVHRPDCRCYVGARELAHTRTHARTHTHIHTHVRTNAHTHTHTRAPMTWERPGRKCAVRVCIRVWDVDPHGCVEKLTTPPQAAWHHCRVVLAWHAGRFLVLALDLSRCTLPSAHLPLCCDGVTAPSILTYTCSDTGNGQRDDCGRVQLPCSRACFLTFAPTPGHPRLVCTAAKLPQKWYYCAPLVCCSNRYTDGLCGDARCQHSRQQALPVPTVPTNQLSRTLTGHQVGARQRVRPAALATKRPARATPCPALSLVCTQTSPKLALICPD